MKKERKDEKVDKMGGREQPIPFFNAHEKQIGDGVGDREASGSQGVKGATAATRTQGFLCLDVVFS